MMRVLGVLLVSICIVANNPVSIVGMGKLSSRRSKSKFRTRRRLLASPARP